MYTPHNPCVYLKAFVGCLAGLGSSGPFDSNPADFSGYARMADAYAQAFDAAWGAAVPTDFEEALIQEASEAAWYAHSPLENGVAFTPGSYTTIAKSVIARVQEGNAQVVSEGIDPNACVPGPTLLNRIQLFNTVGMIPSPDGGFSFDVAIGGAGFPVSPATYTSATGRVRVFVAAMVDADPGDNIQAFPIRDGVEQTPMLYVFPIITYFNGQNSAAVVVEFLDTVTPGSTHTWGIHVTCPHGNTQGTGIINTSRAQIIIEDR
jgi:hypothetical protein